MNYYTQGSLVRMTCAVLVGTTPTNPTTIDFRITMPDGVVTDLSSSIVNDSTGNYHADYITTQVGLHQYEWIGTGAAQVSQVSQFLVSQATF